MRRQQIISTLFWIPFCVFLLFAKQISIYAFGMDVVTSELAYQYILVTLPGFFFLTQYTIISQYCNSQKEMVLPVFCTGGGFIIHVIFLFILV